MNANGETRLKTQPKIQKTNEDEDHEPERVTTSSSEIHEWLQEFRDNLVDGSVPEPHGARVPVLSDSHASSSHELSFRATKASASG